VTDTQVLQRKFWFFSPVSESRVVRGRVTTYTTVHHSGGLHALHQPIGELPVPGSKQFPIPLLVLPMRTSPPVTTPHLHLHPASDNSILPDLSCHPQDIYAILTWFPPLTQALSDHLACSPLLNTPISSFSALSLSSLRRFQPHIASMSLTPTRDSTSSTIHNGGGRGHIVLRRSPKERLWITNDPAFDDRLG
jgi:hypothetical protein